MTEIVFVTDQNHASYFRSNISGTNELCEKARHCICVRDNKGACMGADPECPNPQTSVRTCDDLIQGSVCDLQLNR